MVDIYKEIKIQLHIAGMYILIFNERNKYLRRGFVQQNDITYGIAYNWEVADVYFCRYGNGKALWLYLCTP